MSFPIVEVKTKNQTILHGMLLDGHSKSILIFVHGTASNFYENYFMKFISESLMSKKISILLTNNSGSEVLKAYPPSVL
ncbi:MAG TPA: hypothetical protein HA230_02635 [Candidatus Aenigmarchaeota archaeon]|nr:hypothetical protein [Candidatus Aenigmarchaeota archaeon]